jgi:tetratricopeptide (TPR) repeat protein
MRSRCRRAAIVALLLLAAVLPLRAATLRGVILANELGGAPLSNVEVSALAGANASATDAQGRFRLEFSTRQPGDMVQLVVSKSGYVVVNDFQLHLALPRDPDAEPVSLLVCKEAVREEMARRYYRLKSFEAIEARYQEQLQELKARGEAGAAELAKLTRERNQAKAAAEKAAAELARVKLADTSGLYQQAIRLFVQGKVDEALQILDDEKLQRAAQAARRQAGQVVENYLLKARILTTQFKFDESEGMYQKAMAAVPESFRASFGFASFCLELRRYGKARPAYERALTQAKLSGDEADVARTLNNLGILESDQNRMDDARTAYDEALKIYRKLAQANPDTYLPDVATTLNNLGRLHSAQNRMDDARTAYDEALKIWRRLAQANPDTYLPDVAMTLNNLGILESAQNRMDDARTAYDEALKTYRNLAQANPDTYLPDVAMILNNLGNLESDQNRMDDARTAFDEALKIYRKLAQANPDTYLPDVAMTLNNLGVLNRAQNRMDDARTHYDEVLKIYQALAKKNPERYQRDVESVERFLKGLDAKSDPAK